MTPSALDYSKLDQPEILNIIFHPRRETTPSPLPPNAVDLGIAVDEGIRLSARFHLADKEDPNILFFHGNGEIVSDYDMIGPYYAKFGLNFMVIDYRGYGRSGGSPSATTMMDDSHVVFASIKEWLAAAGHTGPLVVMGRSLGSASALEIASSYQDQIAGLIIESGFATTQPLLMTLGVDVQSLGLTEDDGFQNVRKISSITNPTLIIHGQYDEIIPVNSAAILQAQCPARAKELQIVPGASHNSIIAQAGELYFSTIKQFTNKISGFKPRRRSRRTEN
jgi:pimeloyl-ACP methyl ester carboxylesterase